MDLKMEVYTQSLERLGLLEVQNSVIWESKAFGAGSFSVTSLLTADTRPLLAAENILWIAGDDAGVIEYINKEAEESTNITVKGCNLTGLLVRRILWGRYDLTGTPPQIMHYLVNECAVNPTRGDTVARKIPGLVLLDPPAGGTSIRIQRTGGELLETLEELGATYGVAFGIRFNPAVPQMEFWTRWGVNRSIRQSVNDPVFYSTELDDVLSSEYTYNSGDYRNVALIAGEGEGDDRVMVTVEGEDETYVPDVPTPEPTPEKYTVTLSVDPSGGGVATGGGTVDGGSSVTVTAAPAQKYGFVGWRENGAIVSTEPAYTFRVSRNRSLTAVFVSTVVMYTVTVLSDPAGGGAVSGGGSVEEGQSVTLTQTTADGYNFTGWYNGNTLLSTSNPYTFTPTASITVTAKFAVIPTYTITVLVDPAGGGAASGGGVVQQGQSVTLTQTTTDGYRFSGWYSSSGVLLSTNSTYTFTPTESATITAKFAVISVYTITATIDPSGAGTVTGAGQYQEGAQCTITANPAEGYTFSGWTENGSAVSADESYTFTVTGNRAFVAGFVEKAKELTWAATTMPSNGYWKSVAFGNGKFVSVCQNSNKAAYSTDGIIWSASTLPISTNWRSVAYGNGKFVAVAYGNTVASYSTDGITWKIATVPKANWNCVTYGNGKFVATSLNSNQSAYSTDGVTWKSATMPSTAYWYSVAYGNGKFVAVSDTNKAAYSTDGVTWKSATLPSSNARRSICYGNGKFVTPAYETSSVNYSEDGITWETSTLPASVRWYCVAFGGGTFVAIGQSQTAAYSEDGINWMETQMSSSTSWQGAAYGDNKFVAVSSYNINAAAYTL